MSFSSQIKDELINSILSEYSDILAVALPEIKDMKGFQQHNFH